MSPAQRRVILASASPRRRALLTSLGVRHRVVVPRVEEADHNSLPPAALVKHNAQLKAKAVADKVAGGIVLGADTIVVLGGRIFGKPRNAQAAAHMLRQLGGRTHTVYTGVCLLDPRRHRRFVAVSTTRVTLRRLSSAAIRRYLRGAAPWDKAGAYAVQEWDHMVVDDIRGSLSNVIGLPLHLVEEGLRQLGARA